MTGMKEGAGEDPFAESDSEPEEESDSTLDAEMEDASEARSARAPGATGESLSDGSGRQRNLSATGESPATDQQEMRIPYKLRRDSVQDGRDRVPLFLQTETKRAERDTLHELEDRFDDNISLTDLREALVRVGMNHVDEVETQLAEWGYGMTFDD